MTFRLAQRCAVLSLCALAGGLTAAAQDIHGGGIHFYPGNIVVSRSVYDNKASNVVVGTLLPPNCPSTAKGCGTAPGAPNDGTYPYVWNNDIYDGSFGITSKIFLDQMTPLGFPVNTLQVPNSSMFKIGSESDQLVTSFSSKSELALHLSTDGQYLTFMGYVAPIDTIDVSNSNTPAIVDPTNPVGENFFRAVAQVDAAGNFQFTETNSYSGNNGRAAILNSTDNVFYTAGNAGNGGKTQPDGVIAGAGAQIIEPSVLPEGQQTPGMPTPAGSFSVTQLGAPADKVGKDDNFRGVTIFNNVVYFAKGSGGNGVNTVYFIDTVGTACPNGVGLPVPGASLPTTPLTYDPATLQTNGLPSNMCILAGFPISSNKAVDPTHFPFGLWFADANTLYLADEGDGYADASDLYTHAAAQTTAGLEKWVFDSTTQTWNLVYTLQNGLNLGKPYTIKNYPTGNNAATGLPWAPAPDGLRNIAGEVDGFGLVTIWATTSTVSGNGDTGADPNQLVVITDVLKNANPKVASFERFFTLCTARFGEVLRGVSLTPSAGSPSPE